MTSNTSYQLDPTYVQDVLLPAIRSTTFMTEIGGDMSKFYTFSTAGGLGNSTYSFGIYQWDVGNNPSAQGLLRSIGFSAHEVSLLSQHGGSLSASQKHSLDNKLGAAILNPNNYYTIANFEKNWAQGLVNHLQAAINNIAQSNPNIANQIAHNTSLQLQLVDYDNQFVLDSNGTLVRWLSGQNVSLNNAPYGVTVSNSTNLTSAMISNFVMSTQQGQLYPTSQNNRENTLFEAIGNLNLDTSSGGTGTTGTGGSTVDALTDTTIIVNYSGGHPNPDDVDVKNNPPATTSPYAVTVTPSSVTYGPGIVSHDAYSDVELETALIEAFDSVGDYGGGGIDYEGGYYGFAGSKSTITKSLGSDIGVIAQQALDDGNLKAAKAAKVGLHQAENAALAPSVLSGDSAVVFESSHWNKKVITWSIADKHSDKDSKFSGYLSKGLEGDVARAFATWSKASGLIFKEVKDSSQSDIRIGYGNFDSENSGIAGYTSFSNKDLTIQSGALIRLENPDELALVKDAQGKLAYSKTDAEFSQVLLHEIGHAIGIGTNSDPHSIMYYELNEKNRSLNETDFAAAKTLYGFKENSILGSHNSVNQLIQALSSFAPTTSSHSNIFKIDNINHGAHLLAAAR